MPLWVSRMVVLDSRHVGTTKVVEFCRCTPNRTTVVASSSHGSLQVPEQLEFHIFKKKYPVHMYKLQNSLVFSNKNIVPYLVSLYVSYLCSKVLKILHAILQLTEFELNCILILNTKINYTLNVLDLSNYHLPLDNFVYYDACSINRATPPPPPISYAVGYSQLVLPLSW